MKIIQVAHSFPPRYEGIGNYCYQLSKYLAQRGHQVDVFTSRLYRTSPVQEVRDGFTIHRCPYIGAIGTNRVTFMLNKILRADADVIHAHSYIFFTSNQAALARRIKRKPLLLHLHGGLKLFPSRNFSTNLMFQLKSTIYDQTVGKWTLRSAEAIASVSKHDIQIAQRIFHIDKRFFYWVPNAIHPKLFAKRSSGKALSNVVFIGRLEHKKGIDVLVSVMNNVLKECDDSIFTIVGKGDLHGWIETVAKNHRGRVNIIGQVPHTRIPSILLNATILLLPSYAEGLPTVCLEALASHVPVVASNVGGIPEAVIDGRTGYMFPPGNAQLCAEKVLKLLSDERLRRRMGRCGRSLVKQFYSWQRVVEKVEKIYESMANS